MFILVSVELAYLGRDPYMIYTYQCGCVLYHGCLSPIACDRCDLHIELDQCPKVSYSRKEKFNTI